MEMVSLTPENCLAIQNYLDTLRILRFENISPDKLRSNNIVLTLLELSRQRHSEVLSEMGWKSYCRDYCRRTLSDLYRLTRYYAPSVSVEELYSQLLGLVAKKKVMSWICHEANKRVWGLCGTPAYDSTFGASWTDEFGIDFHDFVSPFLVVERTKGMGGYEHRYSDEAIHFVNYK